MLPKKGCVWISKRYACKDSHLLGRRKWPLFLGYDGDDDDDGVLDIYP